MIAYSDAEEKICALPHSPRDADKVKNETVRSLQGESALLRGLSLHRATRVDPWSVAELLYGEPSLSFYPTSVSADLLRRIDDASRLVPLEDLAISPQCGFASTVEGNIISMDDQWRKLERVVEVSKIALK